MKLKSLLALLLWLPALTQAGERNDVPDCYAYAKIDAFRQVSSGRELTVIVDQTVPMPQSIQKASWAQINRFVGPGDKLRLYSFSAFLPGQFMQLRFTGELNAPLQGEIRDDVGMQSLRAFDKCVVQQQAFMQKKFGQIFVQTLREANEDIPRSEIFHSLREIGSDLSSRPANDRVILLLSDMLENSDFGSFYANSRIRNLDPSAELKRVGDKHLFADLQGARVYVAGAGLMTKDVKQAYRSGKTIEQLQAFWKGYFEGSNASLAAFGTPSLNVDLQ